MWFKNPARCPSDGVFYCLLLIGLLFPRSALANNATPFYVRDQNPLLTIYGVPGSVSARNLAPDASELQLSLNLSNTIIRNTSTNEDLLVDAESYRLNMIYSYGINARWMLRLQLPFIHHGPGFMDDWISEYHDLLGLPEDIRPDYPADEIHISYQREGTRLLSIEESTAGIGDVAVQTAYQAYAEHDFYMSYWVSVELPTGDSEKLTGSGSTDVAVWLAVDKKMDYDAWAFVNLGLIYMTDSEVLTAAHNNATYFASSGMQFHVLPSIKLKFQFEAHGAAYDSASEFLSSAILLSFGGSIILDKTSSLDIAVEEDLQSGSSPDVNFNFGWQQRF